MNIDSYTFGDITIDGQEYHSDVIITPDMVHADWWREHGHNLIDRDLQDIVTVRPEILVIGTGYYGRLQVPQSTVVYLEKMGIQVEIEKTSKAVEKFNELQKHCAKVVAALHLTC